MNKKTKKQHMKVNERALLGQHRGIKFLAAELGDGHRQGIHLLNPTEHESDAALDRALGQGFDTIWVHDSERTFWG